MVELNVTVRDFCINANAVTLRTYHNGNTDRNRIDGCRSDIFSMPPIKDTQMDRHRHRSDCGGNIHMGYAIRRSIGTINIIINMVYEKMDNRPCRQH